MKKVIATVAIILGLGVGANAQSDAFFTQNFSDYRSAEVETPRLPAHMQTSNQDAAPVGTGLLLLAGMGLGYAALRKRK
ncbi:MAG: hypothetical protein IKD32_00470 [Bacteroidales bacterium]|nr:hypothetical protein [Bacteroidales bacterium]